MNEKPGSPLGSSSDQDAKVVLDILKGILPDAEPDVELAEVLSALDDSSDAEVEEALKRLVADAD